jgi:2-polyprenyl-3-methyl-5-hydroxy-6-metoxy-1,4-benzoquinol methylase
MTACRFCGASLTETFCDLGTSPLSNAFLSAADLDRMEPFYPLHALVCGSCFLVQLGQFESPRRIFSDDYAYFSSYSDTWLAHARAYAEAMTQRFSLGRSSQVIEIASNDGYLLKNFAAKGIPVLGIEPAENCARAAEAAGVRTLVAFFDSGLARELKERGTSADLVAGNNVLAHVPQLNDFVAGLKTVLKPHGVITLEFPHLLNLMRETQFDTIYHEHFSYFSFTTVEKVFARQGLELFDVERLATHGGSLRIFAAHAGGGRAPSERVGHLREEEASAGLGEMPAYRAFGERARRAKRKLLEFLVGAKNAGKTVVGYGAPAKGNTLLNYCGVRTDFIDYTVDRSPHKQGKFLPGTHIPVFAPERIRETRPDYILILPWNLKDEVMAQMADARAWGARFVVPIPEAQVLA